MIKLTDLSNTDAYSFLMKQENYCTINLPEYFYFQDILNESEAILKGNEIKSLYNHNKDRPHKHRDTCYSFYINKNFKYGWRQLSIIHPLLYVNLINTITEKNNWDIITGFFSKHETLNDIECHSIPIQSDELGLSDAAALISQWVEKTEQKSLELSLQYNYILQTDIKDCYESLYTHSIPWALHGKSVAKETRGNSLLGNIIDRLIRDMTHGQTNGIPQGSVIMDFIAEIVLAYVDNILSDKIKNNNLKEYKIIRFRDDYRIFTNDPVSANNIVLLLTECLKEVGMELNEHKTSLSDNVIKASLKPSKFSWIKEQKLFSNLKNNLLFLHSFSEEHTNSGTVKRELNNFHLTLEASLQSKNSDELLKEKDSNYIRTLCSITTDIAYRNPSSFPQAIAILSTLLSLIEDDRIRNINISDIIKKLSQLPNTGAMEIWMQRLVIKLNYDYNFDEKLCQLVKEKNKSQIKLWNSIWLNQKTADKINSFNIINQKTIDKMNSVISNEEIALFANQY